MENTSDIYKYICTAQDEGREIKYILRVRLDLFSGTVKMLKAWGGIKLNGTPARVGVTVKEGDEICLNFNAEQTGSDIEPENLPLDILYEDDSIIAINKPAEWVVHPTVFHQGGTLANALMYYWKNKGITAGVHIISRLDLGTSGIVLCARNSYVQSVMRRESEEGTFVKTYAGIITNYTEDFPVSGTIDLPIARKPGSIMEREVSESGDRAVTKYNILKKDTGTSCAFTEFTLETGRTHQIRVHCSHLGHPLLGDTLYGTPSDLISHQALHAVRTEFLHPITGRKITLEAPLPSDFRLSLHGLFPESL